MTALRVNGATRLYAIVGHPIVQVSIYNSAEGVNKIIELPK